MITRPVCLSVSCARTPAAASRLALLCSEFFLGREQRARLHFQWPDQWEKRTLTDPPPPDIGTERPSPPPFPRFTVWVSVGAGGIILVPPPHTLLKITRTPSHTQWSTQRCLHHFSTNMLVKCSMKDEIGLYLNDKVFRIECTSFWICAKMQDGKITV